MSRIWVKCQWFYTAVSYWGGHISKAVRTIESGPEHACSHRLRWICWSGWSSNWMMDEWCCQSSRTRVWVTWGSYSMSLIIPSQLPSTMLEILLRGEDIDCSEVLGAYQRDIPVSTLLVCTPHWGGNTCPSSPLIPWTGGLIDSISSLLELNKCLVSRR
jgi:hypothetical protein